MADETGGDAAAEAPPSGSTGDRLKAVALYNFESQNQDELTVTENEEVTVLLGKSNFCHTISCSHEWTL